MEKDAGDSTDGNIEAPEDKENSLVERKEMRKGTDKNSSANTRNLHQQKMPGEIGRMQECKESTLKILSWKLESVM